MLQLQNSLQAIQENDGHLFKENALSFLEIIEEHNALGRKHHSSTLFSKEESIVDQIEKFQQEIKTPFLQDLMKEIDIALRD